MKLALDGSLNGKYRGDCECGMTWSGQTETDGSRTPSPALPVAEAAVHHRMCHHDQALQLVFTWRFEQWLERYWRTMDASQGLGHATVTR